MLKFLTSILLLILLAQTFSQGWYYVGYIIEKKEYMKRCVNIAKPQMHCEGKCQLMQKLKAQEEREKQQAPELKLAKSELIAAHSNFPRVLVTVKAATKKSYIPTPAGTPIDRSLSILRPPCDNLSL